MNGQELRALFFERLEHRDADAEYELRHPDDVLETPQFAVSGFPNRSHSVVKVVNQGSMSVRVSVMVVSCRDPVQPAAQADQHAGGAEGVPDAVQQPAPAAQRPGACQMGDRLLHQRAQPRLLAGVG
jgi:hypothetical protein